LALVALLGALAVFASSRAPQHGDRQAACRLLAQRFHGECSGTGWFDTPQVRFPYGAVQVTVETLVPSPHSLGRGAAVRVHLPWSGGAWRAEIRYPPWPSRATPLDGLQTLSPPADAWTIPCSVRGTDPRAVAELVTKVVQSHVEQLRTCPKVSPLCIQLDGGAMTITKVLPIQPGPQLIRFVETALELYDQALLTRTRGITFVEPRSAQVLEQVVCRICGEEIREGLVFCRRCKTPHHRECWQYAGRCSVFGCGETEFQTPQVAPRLPGDAAGSARQA